MKVSVIVAAYNAEKYVTETMESLANQSIDDYEIIVVNDGSKDHTIDILRDYESRYDNITVVDKEVDLLRRETADWIWQKESMYTSLMQMMS